jgi:hypothetical protein
LPTTIPVATGTMLGKLFSPMITRNCVIHARLIKKLDTYVEQIIEISKKNCLIDSKKIVILAGGCCVPITLNSTLPDFVNDDFYPYYIAGTWYQSTLNTYNTANTFNGR